MTTDSDQRAETWKAIPGCSGYEASDNSVWRIEVRDVGEAFEGRPVQVSGGIRSIDRTVGGRQLKGVVLKGRLNNSGYVQINVTTDEGVRQTMLAHRLILLAHRGECPDGQETLHSERGPLWCRVPEDMRYGTKPENAAERIAALAAAGRAANGGRLVAPKPPARCIRCGDLLGSSTGRRCHRCIVAIGVEAASLMRAGATLEAANEQLGYAKPAYLHVLAVKYGGWGQCPHCPHCQQQDAADRRRSWFRRVFTLSHRQRGDARSPANGHRQGGDAQ